MKMSNSSGIKVITNLTFVFSFIRPIQRPNNPAEILNLKVRVLLHTSTHHGTLGMIRKKMNRNKNFGNDKKQKFLIKINKEQICIIILYKKPNEKE